MGRQGYGDDDWLTTSRGAEDTHESDRRSRDSGRAPYHEPNEARRRSDTSDERIPDRERSRQRSEESWRGSGDRHGDRYADTDWRPEPETYGSEGGWSRGAWGFRGREYGGGHAGELDDGRYSSEPDTGRSSFDESFRSRTHWNDEYGSERGYERDDRRYERDDRERGYDDESDPAWDFDRWRSRR